MVTERVPYVSPEEYLEAERKAPCRSEYLDGHIYAMAGASYEHTAIVTNLVASVHGSLRGGPCRASAIDLRVLVDETGLYTYPDIVVVCGKPVLRDEHADILTNPALIIEVLSESTEAYDRGEKFAHYRRIPSLQEYVLVSQAKPRIERYLRQDDGQWVYEAVDGPDGVMRLASVGSELPLAAVYEGVEFAEAALREPAGPA